MTIAGRIKERRTELNMTQEDLARAIGLKDKSSVAKIESSGNRVTLKNIEKISEVFGCSVHYLISGSDQNQKPEELQEKDELREIVRTNLIDLRKKKNITQLKLARMIDKSANAVASWEQGLSLPDAVMLYRLSIFYSVKMEYFFEDHKKGGEPK
jgi:transcriptional regulator with XRE-family HTH domain